MTQWFLFHKHCLTICVVYDVIAKMYGKFQVGLERVSHCQITALSIFAAAAAAAKSLQSCPTLCDPIDGSSPGSPIPGILQARTLEWVAISFSNIWKWKVKVKLLSRVRKEMKLGHLCIYTHIFVWFSKFLDLSFCQIHTTERYYIFETS